MRTALALLVPITVGCRGDAPTTQTRPDPCATVRVQRDGSKSFELPAKAEYCLYTPEPVACCKQEGASCDAFAEPAVFDVVRRPGCPAPEAAPSK